jgi:hypothetical protein
MQQLVILLVINCSSTCFGRLYAYHQEVRLCFTAYGFLSCCSCCDVGELGGKLHALCGVGCLTSKLCALCGVGCLTSKLCALCGVGCLTSNLLHTVHAACHPTLQHHNCYNRTENHRQWYGVWLPDDGHKDARNMLRNNWLPIKSLIFASCWSRLYLLIKDARSFEHKVIHIFCYVFRLVRKPSSDSVRQPKMFDNFLYAAWRWICQKTGSWFFWVCCCLTVVYLCFVV